MHALSKTVFSIGLLILSTTGTTWAADATLTDDERAHLVELFEDSRSAMEALASRASGDDWLKRTDPERWSVGEVVEHLAVAEESLFGMVTGALAGSVDPEWETIAEGGVEGVVNTLQDRTQHFEAPPMLEPKGEAPREDTLARYAVARAKTLDFVRTVQAPIKQHTAEGPPGKMNVHQWLALVGAHNLRHNEQIRDVLAQLE